MRPRRQQRGAGRRQQFERLVRRGDLKSARQQLGRGRRRNRHDAVRALKSPLTGRQRRDRHGLRAEQMKPVTAADDVDDRIDRADFVERNLLRRLAVNLPLHFGQQRKNRNGRPFHRLRQRGAFDQRPDFPERVVIMVVVSMLLPVLSAAVMMMLRLRQRDAGTDSRDAVGATRSARRGSYLPTHRRHCQTE